MCQRSKKNRWVREVIWVDAGLVYWWNYLVGDVFTSVASKYDLMNDSMSLGIHRLWKDSFVTSLLPRLPPSRHGDAPTEGFKCLDVAGGTGDIALRILDRAREKFGNREIEVEVVDLTVGMLEEGKKRVAKTMYYNSESFPDSLTSSASPVVRNTWRSGWHRLAPQIKFTHGNAQALPSHIASNSIDLYTIAFGIRNCTSLPAVLSEAYRVLKPGGKIGVLEFGKVGNPLLREWVGSIVPQQFLTVS
jgi:2-methoxy-6-polyprenyl-1,4-benzoquinol methylase